MARGFLNTQFPHGNAIAATGIVLYSESNNRGEALVFSLAGGVMCNWRDKIRALEAHLLDANHYNSRDR